MDRPQITLADLGRFLSLRNTFHALPMERSASDLLSTRGTPPRLDPDEQPFLPDDDDDVWGSV